MATVEQVIEYEGFTFKKKKLPPFDVFVEAIGCDFMGYFRVGSLIARREHKQPKKNGQKSWRWVLENGEKYEFSDDIEAWKYPVEQPQQRGESE